jgi:ribosome biogenesis GTPase / thiamine phosphate phosphatase
LDLQSIGWNQGFRQTWNETIGADPRSEPDAYGAVPDAYTAVPDAYTAVPDAYSAVPDAHTAVPPAFVPARVAGESRGIYFVWSEFGELTAEVSGRFRHAAAEAEGYPAVGDWVAVSPRPAEGKATIHAVVPRANRFIRRDPWSPGGVQTLAANIDTAFLVMGLDRDFSVRRLERYLSLTWESGALPVVLLNKADLVADLRPYLAETETVAFGVPTFGLSAEAGTGLEPLAAWLSPGATVAFLGSSGVGKSTIINRLAGGQTQKTAAVREDDHRGRHTTTRRNLILLPSGAVLLDNPGLREVGLADAENGVQRAFEDIEEMAKDCRFRDCAHHGEPGCAIQAALLDGRLDAERLRNWLHLRKEARFQERKASPLLAMAERDRWKRIHMMARKRREKSR